MAEPDPTAAAAPAEEHVMSIGALSRATGVPVETIRTWERRYGFPQPLRRASGHRRYPASAVERLRLVQRALQLGNRPSAVVGASMGALRQLLDLDRLRAPELPAHEGAGEGDAAWIRAAMAATLALDNGAIERAIEQGWNELGGSAFVGRRAVPWLREIGDAWKRGALGVMHEHFATERLRDFLARQWRGLESHSAGPIVLCSTLPGEAHDLPLHLSAVLLALAGCRIVFLGRNMPIADIARAAADSGAHGVLIGSSAAADPAATKDALRTLRRTLDPAVSLAAGGTAIALDAIGVTPLPTVADVSTWGRHLRG